MQQSVYFWSRKNPIWKLCNVFGDVKLKEQVKIFGQSFEKQHDNLSHHIQLDDAKVAFQRL